MKKIYMFPIVVSAYIGGSIANHLTTYILPTYNEVDLQVLKLIVGFALTTTGLLLGYRAIYLFFKTDGLTNFRLYGSLLAYSAVVGLGMTWVVNGIMRLVLIKFN